MSEEIHAKLLPFLAAAFDRKDHRQAVRVDLLHSQPNTRDVELRRWDRKTAADAPIFESLELTERLIREIIEAAENHADGFGFGSHRFVVRVHEHMGGKSVESFRIKPSFQDGGADSHALVAGGGGGTPNGEALGVMTSHAGQLLRTNQQMFDSSFRTLAVLTENVTDEVKELRRENAELRRKLDAAESTRDDREFQYGMAAEASARKSKNAEKILQIGTAVAAKFTASDLGAPTGVSMLISDLRASLRPEQIAAIMRVLDQGQMIQFGMLMEMIPMTPNQGNQGGTPGAAAAGG